MPRLTPEQLRVLNEKCNQMPLGQLKKYISDGRVVFPDDLPALNPERKRELENALVNEPNPGEQQEWKRLSEKVANPGGSVDEIIQLRDSVQNYINKWQGMRPVGNHVDEAEGVVADLNARVADAMSAIEENDWNRLWNEDGGTTEGLTEYLRKYPQSTHLSEIDDLIWSNLQQSESDITSAAERYILIFPNGQHLPDVNRIRSFRTEWENASAYSDPVEVRQYITNFSDSPFKPEAEKMLMDLKRDELERMRQEGSAYEAQRLIELIDAQVFTEYELRNAHILEPGDLARIRDTERTRSELPNILDEIRMCKNECMEDATDVFFFGIPSTGKSCILMGLVNTPSLHYSSARSGGPYADALNQYVNAGITIGRTPGDFIATIQGEIQNGDAVNKVNLVEMSGEEFAFKLASNEEGEISFNDMGSGAARLLQNNNRKMFFIIVDPTATVVRFQHDVEATDEYGNTMLNEEGRPIMTLRNFNLNQRIMLRRMLSVMMDPVNSEIMQKVDAIHFIVSKADTLDNNHNGNDRESEAMARFRNNFNSEIQPLIRFCREKGINANSDKALDGHPKLYTFSLGDFKIGGLFDFQPDDPEKLVRVMKNNTVGTKDATIFHRFLEFLNKPIF